MLMPNEGAREESIEERLTNAFLDERCGGAFEETLHAAAGAYARMDYQTADHLLQQIGH